MRCWEKGKNASHVNAFLQQLEYEAQTAAVAGAAGLYPGNAGKTSESLTEGIVREQGPARPCTGMRSRRLLYDDDRGRIFAGRGRSAGD